MQKAMEGAYNGQLHKKVYRPEVIGRNIIVRRDYKELRNEKEKELRDL